MLSRGASCPPAVMPNDARPLNESLAADECWSSITERRRMCTRESCCRRMVSMIESTSALSSRSWPTSSTFAVISCMLCSSRIASPAPIVLFTSLPRRRRSPPLSLSLISRCIVSMRWSMRPIARVSISRCCPIWSVACRSAPQSAAFRISDDLWRGAGAAPHSLGRWRPLARALKEVVGETSGEIDSTAELPSGSTRLRPAAAASSGGMRSVG